MKAFEFGLGIFFFFPLLLPLVPSGGQGEEIESRCWWELLSLPPPSLSGQRDVGINGCCVSTEHRGHAPSPGLSCVSAEEVPRPGVCPLTPGSGVIVCRGSLGLGGP